MNERAWLGVNSWRVASTGRTRHHQRPRPALRTHGSENGILAARHSNPMGANMERVWRRGAIAASLRAGVAQWCRRGVSDEDHWGSKRLPRPRSQDHANRATRSQIHPCRARRPRDGRLRRRKARPSRSRQGNGARSHGGRLHHRRRDLFSAPRFGNRGRRDETSPRGTRLQHGLLLRRPSPRPCSSRKPTRSYLLSCCVPV